MSEKTHIITGLPSVDDQVIPAQPSADTLVVGATAVTNQPSPVLEMPPPEEESSKKKKKKSPLILKDETKTKFKDFWVRTRCALNYRAPLTSPKRILSFSTWTDKLLLFFAVVASICTGITMPLMNIVFGKLSLAMSTTYTH